MSALRKVVRRSEFLAEVEIVWVVQQKGSLVAILISDSCYVVSTVEDKKYGSERRGDELKWK